MYVLQSFIHNQQIYTQKLQHIPIDIQHTQYTRIFQINFMKFLYCFITKTVDLYRKPAFILAHILLYIHVYTSASMLLLFNIVLAANDGTKRIAKGTGGPDSIHTCNGKIVHGKNNNINNNKQDNMDGRERVVGGGIDRGEHRVESMKHQL